MLLSYNWLKKYVNLSDSTTPEEVAARLKASTVEVENIEVQGKKLENIVIGKIISVEKHPNADKLKLCIVDVGNEKLQIVCGGSNVAAGMLIALAKVGAKVKWHGEGELIELKATKIRDVESAGMICASTEIGLGEMFPLSDEKEILDLTFTKAKPGTPLVKTLELNDAILEIDNKSLSNRPDLWGHYGMAREMAVLFNKNLKEYKAEKLKAGKGVDLLVEVEDSKLCPRYMAVAVSGVKVGPSPAWLKKSLDAVGLRSINNIVDITNFVMLDLGQPMHAFDAQQLATNNKQVAIQVKNAKDGEEFVTLDEQKRKLDSSMLMICSGDKPLAIAGVMGGLQSGITDQTNTIIFESANFEASAIRQTSAKLSLRTDSSARFEKSLDPNLTQVALQKAVELTLACCPEAKVASKVVDKSAFHLRQGPIEFSLAFLEKKVGIKIPLKEVKRILEQLGFTIKTKGENLLVTIPSWRATKDISIAEDLVEEVVRIYGYDKIPGSLPTFTIEPPAENRLRKLERQIKNVLGNSLAYTEVYNYSFVSGAQIQKMGDSAEKYIELDNPLSKEKPYLRRCLLLNLLENLECNQANVPGLRLFEVGKVFRLDEPGLRAEANGDELLPGQDTWCTTVCLEKKNDNPFWEAKKVVEVLAQKFGLDIMLKSEAVVGLGRHPSRSASLYVGEQHIGSVYELHPQVASGFSLDGRVGVVKMNLSMLAEMTQAENKYKFLPAFPAIERDVAIVVDKKITHQDIMSAVVGVDSLLTSVRLFDVYDGVKLGVDKKSMAYHFIYQSNERTLVSEEVEKAHAGIIKILREKFKAEVR